MKNILSTSTSSGLILEDASNKDVSLLYDYIKENATDSINFYRNMLNIFTGNTGANAELVLLKIDYEACLIQTQRAYEKELEHNNECNEKIQTDNSPAVFRREDGI